MERLVSPRDFKRQHSVHVLIRYTEHWLHERRRRIKEDSNLNDTMADRDKIIINRKAGKRLDYFT